MNILSEQRSSRELHRALESKRLAAASPPPPGGERSDCPSGSDKNLVWHEVDCPQGPTQIGLFRAGVKYAMNAVWFHCGLRTQLGSTRESSEIPHSKRGKWILGSPESKYGRVGGICILIDNENLIS